MLLVIMSVNLIGCQSKEALKNEKAYRKAGIDKMEQNDYPKAVGLFQKALDQSVGVVGELEVDICYYKAAAQYKSGDTQGAIKTYTSLIEYDEKNGNALYLRGCIYLKENNVDQAWKDFKQAIKVKKDDYELYSAIYDNMNNIGDTAKAASVLESALKLEGSSAEYYRERGHFYLLSGDYENARKELDKAINKKDTKALLYMAEVYDAKGSPEQANALYESYIARDGADTEVLNMLGQKQLDTGNYTQALKFFQTALAAKNVNNEQQLRKNEIVAYEYLLDFPSAKAKMEAYLMDYPQDEEAQREAVFLRTR